MVGFKNAIIVMTSNMGSQDILQAMQIDPDSVKARVMAQVRAPPAAAACPESHKDILQRARPLPGTGTC